MMMIVQAESGPKLAWEPEQQGQQLLRQQKLLRELLLQFFL